jgi:glucose-6-phosphate isomerase
MQLPDETIAYQYQSLLFPPGLNWSPVAELKARHFLDPARLRALQPQLLQVRSQVLTERELKEVPADLQPLDSGFIDLPQEMLEGLRRKGETSDLGQVMSQAARLRSQVDHVVVLGAGGSYLGGRAIFQALKSAYHNELRADARMGIPRIYFEGNNFDNDSLQELIDLLQATCVDPEIREERWGMIAVSKSGSTLETAAAFRIMRKEAAEYYGSRSERLRQLIVPVTGPTGKFRDLCRALGYTDEDILTIPDRVGGRFSVFSPAGLLPAAVMGLDIRAMLLGAASVTRRFLEEPFERNPVLQYAGVNYLMATEMEKPLRVLGIWSSKLEALGLWYDQLLSESLAKMGRGPTPLTAILTRDLHSRGQQHQDGVRDKLVNNLVVKAPRTSPIPLGMADQNEDDLNTISRKSYPDLMDAALQGTMEAYEEAARPTAKLVLPNLSEHALGQLMQMLMLATVVEGRLMGVNPYGQPGVEAYKQKMHGLLRGTPP